MPKPSRIFRAGFNLVFLPYSNINLGVVNPILWSLNRIKAALYVRQDLDPRLIRILWIIPHSVLDTIGQTFPEFEHHILNEVLFCLKSILVAMDECSQSGITSGVYCLDGFIFNLLRHYFVFTLGLKVKSSFSSWDTLSLHPGVHSTRESHEILTLKKKQKSNILFILSCNSLTIFRHSNKDFIYFFFALKSSLLQFSLPCSLLWLQILILNPIPHPQMGRAPLEQSSVPTIPEITG